MDDQSPVANEYRAIIDTPSVSDNRSSLAVDVQEVIKKHGLGVGMQVLHLQQVKTGHIPIEANASTKVLYADNECGFLWVPARRYRGDTQELQKRGIVDRCADPRQYVTHETDGNTCYYCSAPVMNPKEVLVTYESHRLSRMYELGFTFAPFGDGKNVVHFLAWDKPKQERPLNMDLQEYTVADLMVLVEEVNAPVRQYFSAHKIQSFPTLDGIFNGWGGASIWHQHYQFFRLELKRGMPVKARKPRSLLVSRETFTVSRLDWTVPVYRIDSKGLQAAAGTATAIAQEWARLTPEYRRVPYRSSLKNPQTWDHVAADAANIYVPGSREGIPDAANYTVFVFPRDVAKSAYKSGVKPDLPQGPIPEKKGIATLEVAGAFVIDEEATFSYLLRLENEAQRSVVARAWHEAVTPGAESIQQLEQFIGAL